MKEQKKNVVNAETDETSVGTEQRKKQNNYKTQDFLRFNDFLKDSNNQAEFDRRVQKAIQTAKNSWEMKNIEKIEDEILVQMNKNEKLQKQKKIYENIQKKLDTKGLNNEAKIPIIYEIHYNTITDSFVQIK